MEPERKVKSDPRRGLPGTDRLSERMRVAHPELPAWAAAAAARATLAAAREALGAQPGDARAPSEDALLRQAAARAASLCAARPGRVVNATGVVLHTNLGRAPLAPGAVAALAAAAASSSDLELVSALGDRGQTTALQAFSVGRDLDPVADGRDGLLSLEERARERDQIRVVAQVFRGSAT